MSGQKRGDSEVVYSRTLPGGGFVEIEVKPVRRLFADDILHGEVIVERRADQKRRERHGAPVVAQADSRDVTSLLHELFPIASSNVALARACVARERVSYVSETSRTSRSPAP